MKRKDVLAMGKGVLFTALILLLLGAALYGCYSLFLTVVGDVAHEIKSN